LGRLIRTVIPEMTYNMSSLMLNPTIPVRVPYLHAVSKKVVSFSVRAVIMHNVN